MRIPVKLLICFGFLALCVALSIGVPRTVVGQSEATIVLGEIRARYGGLRSLRARFDQRFHHRLHARDERWRGRLALQRPGRLRIDYDVPRGRVVTSDGARLVSFEPEPAPGQYYEQELGEDALPLALGLLLGEGPPDDAWAARLVDTRETSARGTVLELRPAQPVPLYERLWLYVDRSEASRGRVHRILVIDAAGNTNRFDLHHQVENPRLGASLFTFHPPAGARRIEP